MQITKTELTALGVSAAHADQYLETLNASMQAHGIDTALRIAHFLAQVLHESCLMAHVSENLNYSAEGLQKTFGKYFPNRALADTYARKPEPIACRVYANRMGNGDEASEDGWHYRGRGLLQLTGKANYAAFSHWAGQDCVAQPDLVAAGLAAASAVYYWDCNHLNALADTDDLKAITKRVNGGLNGFAERQQLLNQAKRVLAVAPQAGATTPTLPAGVSFTPSHRVCATMLHLRREPQVSPTNVIATLCQGTSVEQQTGELQGDQQAGTNATDGWVRVRVPLSGTLREGWVLDRYLEPLPQSLGLPGERTEGVAAALIPPPAALAPAAEPVTRARNDARVYPLSEAGCPRVTGSTTGTQAGDLIAIVDWLDCENPAYGRYRPRGSATAARTYVCDYCDLAGVYLPRVWWSGPALVQIGEGKVVVPACGRTVRELCANALHDWLEDFGPAFGWLREIELINLQEAANAGEVCIITAKAQDPGDAGQAAAILPEQAPVMAARDALGDVQFPVQSWCGPRNVRRETADSTWWLNESLQGYGLWRHPR